MERRVSSLEWDRRSPLLLESLPCASVTTEVLMATAAGATAAGVAPGPAAVSRTLAAAAAAAESAVFCIAGAVAAAMPAPGCGRIVAAELFGIRRVVVGPKATYGHSTQL
jgi:heterodisulfide reductase subunit A-like polyferredoxin